MNKFLMTSAAIASLVLGTAVAMADDTAPLPAGGPAAQASGPLVGSTVEIAGVVVAVTVAGLVTINSDNDSLPPVSPPPTSTPTSGTGA